LCILVSIGSRVYIGGDCDCGATQL